MAMGSPDPKEFDANYVINDLRRLWLRVAANEQWFKNDWLGVPIWQLPEDLIFLQNIVSSIKPSIIIETGTKYGGSAIYLASLLKLLDLNHSKIYTIDLVETEEAKENLSNHSLAQYVQERIVTSSLEPATVSHLRDVCSANLEPLMILLDDWHGGEHVKAELEAYAPLLKEGDILIVADTSFADLAGTPIAPFKSLATSNPRTALISFLAENPCYELTNQYSPQGISNFADGCIQLKRT